MKTKIFTLAILILSSANLNAAQIIPVADGIEVWVTISASSLNRIKIEGGRIDKSPSVSEDLEITRDEDSGEIYVNLPNRSGKKLYSTRTLFIVSDSGETFTLYIKPKNLKAGQQIFLIPQSAKDQELKIYDSYRDQLLTFYKSLYLGTIPQNYKVVHKKQKSKKGKLKIVKITTYNPPANTGFYGEIFEITNKSKELKILKPQDFYQEGIRAVKLDSHLLQKGESTKMYIISIKG